ncbi:MBG domain-containing protein [Christiangramia salexigens]|uniref:Secretion system C-terminal sorting domain-containing protein n=1 Tax=Christiangramia salexigens TaxID=1913577 RepID=A0A1L3J537_9FLAO|nr:MBG domain-containing protein [Christiangramia salexigens]APG60236.1 hypothetical protein LPB144_07355 [Christiangramia salexigens]
MIDSIILEMRTFRKLSLFLIGWLFVFSGWAQNYPNISSDKPDYEPGSTAIFTGSDFHANETITLQVVHVADEINDFNMPEHRPWQVVADQQGKFTANWILHDSHCYNKILRVTAIGENSREKVWHEFTDPTFTTTSTGGDWNATTTWSGGAIPTSSDDVAVAVGATLTLTDNRTINSITLLGGNNSTKLNFNGNRTLTVTNISGVKINSPSGNGNVNEIDLAVGTLTISGNLFIDGGSNKTGRLKVNTGVVNVSGNVTLNHSNSEIQFYNLATGKLNIGGDFTNNGPNQLNFIPGSGTVKFNGSSSQIIGGDATINIFYNLEIANTGGGVSLFKPLTVANNLILTSGILSTDATNLLSVTNSLPGAISSGSSSKFINGPLRWSIGTGNYLLPVGKGTGAYLPYRLVTSASSTPVITVEAFNSGAGGSSDASLSSISSSEYWKADLNSGSFTGKVSLTRIAALTTENVIGRSASQAGVYSSIGGTASSPSINNSNDINSLGFFTMATSAASCATGIAAPTPATQTVCNNSNITSLTTSGQTGGTGSGFTYQWYSNTSNSNTGGTILNSPSNISNGSQTLTYTPPATTTAGTIYYYVVVSRGGCTSISSSTASVTIRPQFTTGTIASTGQIICYGTTPTTLIGSTTSASGGDNNITYQWQSSTDAGFTSPTTLGSSNSATLAPSTPLTQDTWYRRQAKDGTCNTTFTSSANTWKVTVNPNPTLTTTGTLGSVSYATTSQTTSLSYSGTTGSPNSYRIDWDDSANNAGLADQANTAFSFSGVGGTLTGINITAGTPAGTYAGTMTITNAGSCVGTQAVSLIIGKATPVITWNNPSDITYGTALSGTQLNASASVAGTFVYSPLTGTVLDAGNGQLLSVDYTPTDTDNYNSVNGTSVTLDVLKKVLAVTANAADITYGDAAPSVSVSYSGFVGGDNATDLDDTGFSLGTDYIQYDTVGTYSTTISIGSATDNNYDFTPLKTSSFAVEQRDITITVDAGQTKIYGDSDPSAYTASVTSGVIQGSDVASGTLLRVAGESVGLYAITQNDYTYGSNYNETFVGDDFSITQRDITITVDAGQTKIYGDSDPSAYTASVTSGVIQGSDVASGTLLRVAGESVGLYAITQNDYTYGSNYNETFVGDDFSITQRDITITVDAGQTKIYGDSDPSAYTASVTSGVIQGSDVASGTLLRVAGESVGLYAITQNDYTYGSNYNETFVGDDFSITQRDITITVDAGQTKIYGDSDPSAYTASVTSGVIQGSDVASGTLLRVAGESVGLYAITQNDYTYGSNYNETFVGDDFSITQRDITITVDAGQTKIYGDSDPSAYTASVTSGVIQGSDVASGTLLRVAGESVGLYAITQNDYTYGSNYNETFVGDDFSITQRDITITVDAGQTKIYGDSDPSAYTASVTSGVIQGSDVASGTLLRVAGESVGLYAITQNDYTYGSNYNETFVGDDFSITQRDITITVDAGQTKIYGDSDPSAYTASVTSGVIQGSDVASGTLLRVAGESVGLYAITQNDYTYGSNYNETFVGDDFSITQRDITITVDAGQTKIYGDSDPSAYTASVTSGVIQGSDVASGTLLRVAGESVGLYAITQNDYTYGSNYNETFVGDDFSITQRDITITVDAGQTKIYGDSDPSAYTASVTSGVIQGSDVASGTLLRVAGESVGLYAITQNDYTYGSNYNETFVGDDFSITQRDITITVDAGQTKIYGDSDPSAYTASVTSGVIQGSDVASGTLLRVAGESVGLYAITQNDYTYGSNYNETFVGDDFSITQRDITITVDAGQTKIYGDSDPSAYTASVTSGVIQGSDVASGTLLRVAGESVGLYAITQNDYTYGSNYNETFVGDDFSITQRDITITVDAGQTKIYGDSDPSAYTASVTSGVIQGSDVASGTLLRVAGESVGLYAITQNDYTYGSNYNETFVGDDFSITQRDITITVDAGQTKIYGDSDPSAYTASVTSGVIQGSDVASGTLLRVAGESVGLYAITQNDYTYGSNYNETFVGDDFSITQRDITITVDAGQTKIYGDSDPSAYTASVTSGVIQGSDVASGTLLRVAGESVGLYAITQNDYTYGSNYNETFVGDDFSITQRDITITVDAGQTKIYGDSDPSAYTASVTSGVIQGSDVASGTLLRAAGESVGLYAITQNDYTYGSNYNETFVGDDFSITQRDITITVDAGQTKIYGDSDPSAYTASVTSGVIQGSDVASGTLLRVAGESVGLYAITQNDYTYGSNYNETFVGDDFSITQRDITITVDAGQTKIYGDSDPSAYTASVTSGVIQGSDVASGTLLRVAGESVGLYAITQNDYTYGSNYNETFVGDDFSITQRDITITVDAGQTKIYGDSDPSAYTASVTSGVIQGSDVASGTLLRVAGESVGLYAITQNDYTYGSNYNETFVGDDFSITQRDITITVDAGQTKIYGDSDPSAYTASVTSGVIQGSDVASGTLLRVAGESVGLYAITQNDYTYGSNYNETFVGDDFSITQRDITITVDAGQTKIYGDSDPSAYTASVTSGVIQGSDVASGTLLRVAGESVGLYAITQNDYTYGSNYNETFVGDDFSITQRDITITVDAGQTKIYGDSDPSAYTASVTSGVIQGSDVASGTLLRVAGESVGLYAITQNDYTYGSNYNETFVGDDFSITQRDITITVDAGQTKIYGDSDPSAYTASVTSGVIQGSDVASGTLLRVAGESVGLYAITQNDYTYGSNYNETFVGDDFSITQRDITITVDAGQTKIYGDSDPSAYTASVTSGVIQGSDVASGTLLRVAGESVGLYAITQNDYTYGSNYNETFVGDDFSITQRDITITVDAGQTKIYGDSDPSAYTASVTSGVIQGSDVASGTLLRVAGESVGLYAITQNDYTYGSNYNETFVGDDFSITQRDITITVDAGQTKIYGDSDPSAYTASVTSGVIQGSDVASGTLLRVAGESVGLYAITQNDYTYGSNYNETFVGDDFSITQRDITITVDAGQTKIYGDSDPSAYTASVTSGVIQGSDVASGTLLRVAGESVGLYAITQNDYTYGSNYNETFVGDDFSITQRDITITVDAGQTKIYGDSDPSAYTASVTSGVIQGSDVASGTLLRVAGESVGLYAITQNDYTYGSNYNETFVGDDFSITQRDITITVDAGQTKIYGDSDPSAYTASVTSGVIQGSDVASGTLLRVAGESVGLYAITQNDYTYGSNYNETFVGDDFSITQRDITITVDAGQTKIYGDSDPSAYTASVTSGVIQGSDVASGTLLRVAGESVGLYAITQNDYTYGSNYNETFVGDDFSITTKSASVTPNVFSKFCGQDDPEFTGVLSGFLEDDGVSAEYSRVEGEEVGDYIISAELGPEVILSNYDITYNTVLFTIDGITVDASDSSTPIQKGSVANLSATVTPNVPGILVSFYMNDVFKGTGITNTSGKATLVVNGLDVDVYLVKAIAGNSCSESIAYLPVYDPSGGFVTGGGWIDSKVGAVRPNIYELDPQASGKANFGFVAKYKSGKNNTSQVDGNTEFQFKAGNLNFKSSSYTEMSLIVTPDKATYKGEGTLNGNPGFKFTVIAIDGDAKGKANNDKFRIRIWSPGPQNKLVYDNLLTGTDAEEYNESSDYIGGGSIVIHKAKGKGTEENEKPVAIRVEEDKQVYEILNTLEIAPNPVLYSTEIRFSLKDRLRADLRIYDLNGRLVRSLYSGVVDANELVQVSFNRENLMSGIYICKLVTGNGRTYEKQVLIK